MTRNETVLAALAAGGVGASFDPVQIQKYFFLIDRELRQWVGGPHFRFKPYDYGPFDKEVYDVLETLVEDGYVRIDSEHRYRTYSLTQSGLKRGRETLDGLPKPVVEYLTSAAQWVRGLSFRQLLSSIYHHYPDMAVNSVVSNITTPSGRSATKYPTPSFSSGLARTFDFMGSLNEYRLGWLDESNDVLAIDEDWHVVGDDLRSAMILHSLEDQHEP